MRSCFVALVALLFWGNFSVLAQFDPRFPDGFDTPTSHRISLTDKEKVFVVPEGKNFYLTRLTTLAPSLMSSSASLDVNGVGILSFNRGSELCGVSADQYFVTPLILKGGDKVTLTGKGEAYLQGFTVESKITPVILDNDQAFELPKGKTFVLLHTIKNRECEIAYKSKFAFTEIDALHFPEFFSTQESIEKLDKSGVRLGYIY